MFPALFMHILREITPPSPEARLNPKRQVEVQMYKTLCQVNGMSEIRMKKEEKNRVKVCLPEYTFSSQFK